MHKARLASRPVMVAGQLMEGMAVAPRPSRPEITDVVNAVYDGADAVVLMQVKLMVADEWRCAPCRKMHLMMACQSSSRFRSLPNIIFVNSCYYATR